MAARRETRKHRQRAGRPSAPCPVCGDPAHGILDCPEGPPAPARLPDALEAPGGAELPGSEAELLAQLDDLRPKTRGECEGGERPCPWVRCRHHLLPVQAHGPPPRRRRRRRAKHRTPPYLAQMPPVLRLRIEALLVEQEDALADLAAAGVAPAELQNYVAMGYMVPCRVTQTLPHLVYRLELRTKRTVHPTLRPVAQVEARWLAAELPFASLHVDLSADDWDVRRGAQTIEERAPVPLS